MYIFAYLYYLYMYLFSFLNTPPQPHFSHQGYIHYGSVAFVSVEG